MVVVALLGALVAWRALDDEPYQAEPGTPASTSSAATAAATLRDLVRALSEGDTDAARDLAAPTDGSADLLAAVAANASALGLGDLDLRYVTEASGVDAQGSWTAVVEASWRVVGFDRRTASTEVAVAFAEGGASVVRLGGEPGPTPVWMAGPAQVRRAGGTLVVAADEALAGAGGQERLDGWVAEARRATQQVGAVLDDRPRLVVEVPGSSAALDEALDVEPGTYAAIAAVTAPVDGTSGARAPVHVFLNPGVYGELDGTAAQVVMTHEAVHVVTDAPARTDEPLWLIEGFADYVALRDVDLPLSTTAGQVAEQVRRRGAPDALPDEAAFSTRETHLGASYEAAWVACLVLADRGGEQALVTLYDRARDEPALQAQLRSGFGWTTADLVGAWQQRLRDLAG